jgi:hypothetical protein
MAVLSFLGGFIASGLLPQVYCLRFIASGLLPEVYCLRFIA